MRPDRARARIRLVDTPKKMRLLIPCLLVAAFVCPDASALTRMSETAGPPLFGNPGQFHAMKDGVSLDEAVEIVRKRYGGRVINASTRKDDGRKVHVIKILSDEGRVRTVRVDAQSGNLM